jgi:hypothetical protein
MSAKVAFGAPIVVIAPTKAIFAVIARRLGQVRQTWNKEYIVEHQTLQLLFCIMQSRPYIYIFSAMAPSQTGNQRKDRDRILEK